MRCGWHTQSILHQGVPASACDACNYYLQTVVRTPARTARKDSRFNMFNMPLFARRVLHKLVVSSLHPASAKEEGKKAVRGKGQKFVYSEKQDLPVLWKVSNCLANDKNKVALHTHLPAVMNSSCPQGYLSYSCHASVSPSKSPSQSVQC